MQDFVSNLDDVVEDEHQVGYPEEVPKKQYVYTDAASKFSPLIDAILMGELKIQILCVLFSYLTSFFPQLFTLKGDEKSSEELIENGADINELDGYGRSPLYVSILHGNLVNSSTIKSEIRNKFSFRDVFNAFRLIPFVYEIYFKRA